LLHELIAQRIVYSILDYTPDVENDEMDVSIFGDTCSNEDSDGSSSDDSDSTSGGDGDGIGRMI
jgi:hypothetical protein